MAIGSAGPGMTGKEVWQRKVRVGIAALFLAGVVAACAVVASQPSAASEHVELDYIAHEIRKSTRVSTPAAFDPRVGQMFGKLVMLSFDCVVELKRALRGRYDNPDYDAKAHVEFVEGMLHHLVRRLGMTDLPPPKLGGRLASFPMAVKKVKLLRRLVKYIPKERTVKTIRQERYAVLKFDIEQISASLMTIVYKLMERDFAAIEPKQTQMDRIINELNHAKVNKEKPIFHTPTWDDVSQDIREHIVKDTVQELPLVGSSNAPLPAAALHNTASKNAMRNVIKQASEIAGQNAAQTLRTFSFSGTMDPQGELIGTLSPKH